MIFQLYIIFAMPLVLALLLTPVVMRFARRVGAMDQPNERKVHKFPVPRLGGLAIYASFFISLLISIYLDPALHPFSSMHPQRGVMLVISLTIVLIIGIWDDIRSVSPAKKFLGQFFAAAIVYAAGFRISAITSPLDLNLWHLGIFEFPATILWIVGITNAFNLIDGLDGLASGVAFIVALTISIISFLKGDVTTAMMALLLAGAVLGFLRYNFNGAKIFLGDSGSLFLGFLLAILSMQSSTKGSAAFSLLVPVLTLGLPIMDTMLAMIRRFLRSIVPGQQGSKSFLSKMVTMFLPDRGHIHHQLIARGLSHRTVVLLLYVVSCLFGLGAFAVTMTNNISTSPVLFTIGVATFIGVSQLRYKEMAVLRNGVLLPMYEWPVMNSTMFQGFLDLAFIIGSFTAATLITSGSESGHRFHAGFFTQLAVLCGVRLTVFASGGLYKGTFRSIAIGDLLKVFKTVTLAVICSWTLLAFLPSPLGIVNIAVILLDFYLLISLTLGARISFQVLNYLSRREQHHGKTKVLIYGADARGMFMMEQILHDDSLHYSPVGFLDEDPQLERKSLGGYPVFGGHWKLDHVLPSLHIREIIICSDSLRPEVIKRIHLSARNHGVLVRTLRIKLDLMEQSEKHPVVNPERVRVEAK